MLWNFILPEICEDKKAVNDPVYRFFREYTRVRVPVTVTGTFSSKESAESPDDVVQIEISTCLLFCVLVLIYDTNLGAYMNVFGLAV